MPTSELAALLDHADTTTRPAILQAAVAAGLMWKCPNPHCPRTNHRAHELCHSCGHDRAGRPLADCQPGLYVAPDELWEHLRAQITDHIRRQPIAFPDAVTFTWHTDQNDCPWSLTDLLLHYGGEQRQHHTSLNGTDIAETLEEITLAVEPNYLDNLRITLTR